MNIISKASKSVFKDSAYGIIKAGELYYSEKLLEPSTVIEDVTFTFPEASGLELKGSRPVSGNMILTKYGEVAIAISNGKYCVREGYDDADVLVDENIEDCEIPVIVKKLVTSISLSQENVTLTLDCREYSDAEKYLVLIDDYEDITITSTVLPNDASNKKLKWTSLNPDIATVDQNGKITAVSNGTSDGNGNLTSTDDASTKIIVETTDGSNLRKEINVTVHVSSVGTPELGGGEVIDPELEG